MLINKKVFKTKCEDNLTYNNLNNINHHKDTDGRPLVEIRAGLGAKIAVDMTLKTCVYPDSRKIMAAQ
ncbi:hypothetical protein ORJ04_18555 [Rheinheimera baltica]|uniref:Uncharacterized protein n=1 Tax=Rheinheimera baltica TaxID=67576 RepID=A0ABT9I4N1_9GAMM|nr:hypothetical protein [Rheinheimera baltica]MDP5137955.1 hypothetical protein [Rheinheimera baltica]